MHSRTGRPCKEYHTPHALSEFVKKTSTYTDDVHKLDLMISLFLDLAET
jgi:hypothetical protein